MIYALCSILKSSYIYIFRVPTSIQKTVLFSAKQINSTSYIEGFNGDGYISNSLLYGSFAISNFFAPWVIGKIGPKYSMFLGTLGYTVYAAQMLYLSDILLYTCALVNGVGASLLWTGQGTFLSINSSPTSAARDSGESEKICQLFVHLKSFPCIHSCILKKYFFQAFSGPFIN